MVELYGSYFLIIMIIRGGSMRAFRKNIIRLGYVIGTKFKEVYLPPKENQNFGQEIDSGIRWKWIDTLHSKLSDSINIFFYCFILFIYFLFFLFFSLFLLYY